MHTAALCQIALLTLIGMIDIMNLFVSFSARFMPDKKEDSKAGTTGTAAAAIATALKIKKD